MSQAPASGYVCDTIPAARLATDADQVVEVDEPAADAPTPTVRDESATKDADAELEPISPPPPPPRKLCVRHQRMADEGTNLKLQQSLDALPLEERQVVNSIWSNFSSSSHPRRALILQGLLTMCCFSQLSLLTEYLTHLIRIDPFTVFPREVSLKVLSYLDATSLCRAAQVTKKWRELADDDVLWKGICEQHIGQKCHTCGWCLPRLEKKRSYHDASRVPSPSPSPGPSTLKRPLIVNADEVHTDVRPLKRARSSASEHVSPHPPPSHLISSSQEDPSCGSCSLLVTPSPIPPHAGTRPWKAVYSERLTIERNWRRGRCTVRAFKGHTDGVMCLQYLDNLTHPAFPVLITGSYDRTARVWNMETGAELHCLKGHTRAIRALQFDEVKLITGSMDSTLKVWDWRRGKCIRTLVGGHTEGVVCLNFDSNVLASGSVDSTIKVWNLRTGGAFTLRGHSDWVNSVLLWDSKSISTPDPSSSLSAFDVPGCAAPQIDPGKMLFSASDDGTIKLWDLTSRTCVRQFSGHVGQVQSIKLLMEDEGEDEDHNEKTQVPLERAAAELSLSPPLPASKPKQPVLISGSLDNTIKIWDIDTGKTVRTFFGHIEGVWSVASDRLRLVSASQDRTIKVWSREDGTCTATLVGHRAAVNCLALGEDKIVSGSDDSDVRVWSFSR